MDDQIPDFMAITSSSPEVARGFLEIAGNDLERAVALFFENPDLVSSGLSAAASQPPAPVSRSNIGREDASGVIHIDSDDDDNDMTMDFDSGPDDGGTQAVAQAVARAQEDEDAAMAKRLQEELYQGTEGGGSAGGMAGDDVRAPIARTTETLVAPDPSWGGDDDMHQAILDQLRQRRQPPGTEYEM